MLPERGGGLQAVLCGKRGRRSLQASESLSAGVSDEIGRGREKGGGMRGQVMRLSACSW